MASMAEESGSEGRCEEKLRWLGLGFVLIELVMGAGYGRGELEWDGEQVGAVCEGLM